MLAAAAQQLYTAARARVFVVKPPVSAMQFPAVSRVLEPSAKWLALMQVLFSSFFRSVFVLQ
jgi:hypothetical protein